MRVAQVHPEVELRGRAAVWKRSLAKPRRPWAATWARERARMVGETFLKQELYRGYISSCSNLL